MKWNKKLLIPIVSLLLFFLKRIFNVQFSTEEFDLIVEGLFAIGVLSGLAMKSKI